MLRSADQASSAIDRQPWSVKTEKSSRLSLRQQLPISWQRMRRWEFWPAWLFYLPIIGWIVWLGLRFRSPTLFTAVNPIMESGGVVGERKYLVLHTLQENAPDLVAESLLLTGDSVARIRQAETFADQVGYPVILKPDIGQRGRGVFLAAHAADLREYLQRFRDEVIVQAFVEGDEYGVFVARRPGQASPRILSVVRKTFPQIVGDGRATVAELILADDRARLSANVFFAHLGDRLDEVMPTDKVLKLVKFGSHCRGSLFLDAMDQISPELLTTLTRLMDAVPGYDFGRIDLRVTPDGRLKGGTGIKVLELNGVTSESAHIYQPGTPLRVGYRIMFDQWAEAFAIGAARVQLGAQTTSPMTLLRQFRADLKRGRQWF